MSEKRRTIQCKLLQQPASVMSWRVEVSGLGSSTVGFHEDHECDHEWVCPYAMDPQCAVNRLRGSCGPA